MSGSIIPTRPNEDNLYTHLFRAVYPAIRMTALSQRLIATWFYCPVSVDATEFKAHCQGHFAFIDEKNPEIRREARQFSPLF